ATPSRRACLPNGLEIGEDGHHVLRGEDLLERARSLASPIVRLGARSGAVLRLRLTPEILERGDDHSRAPRTEIQQHGSEYLDRAGLSRVVEQLLFAQKSDEGVA